MRADADLLADLRALVEVESPSDDVAATERCAEVAAALGETALGRRPERVASGRRRSLLWRSGPPRVLVLGHLDTVWPTGTLDRWPFAVDGERATGPGVFDMKAGVVQVFAALSGLDADGVAVLLSTDEEIGSPASRPLIEEVASGARAALLAGPAPVRPSSPSRAPAEPSRRSARASGSTGSTCTAGPRTPASTPRRV